MLRTLRSAWLKHLVFCAPAKFPTLVDNGGDRDWEKNDEGSFATKMKKGINYECFPKELTGEKSIVAAMETAKAVGFDAIELSIFETGALALDTSPGAVKQIANAAQDIGIKICSLW